MSDSKHEKSQSRRTFLRGAAATGAGALIAGQAAAEGQPDKLITDIQPRLNVCYQLIRLTLCGSLSCNQSPSTSCRCPAQKCPARL